VAILTSQWSNIQNPSSGENYNLTTNKQMQQHEHNSNDITNNDKNKHKQYTDHNVQTMTMAAIHSIQSTVSQQSVQPTYYKEY
jgi:hypothetical protein